MTTLLGKGTYGAVRYRHKNETVVKKFKQPDNVIVSCRANVAISTSMLREIGLLKYLNGHANIIKILGVGHGEVLLEHGGQTLRSLIGQISGAASSIIQQLAAAVNYMHVNGVVHRDIKPENILVNAAGQLAVCDFGISTVVDGHGMTETVDSRRMTETVYGYKTEETVGHWHQRKIVSKIGTYRYRAPELFIDMPLDVMAVDIWAFGCVVYEVLVGKYAVTDHMVAMLVQEALAGAEQFTTIVDKLANDLGDYYGLLYGCFLPTAYRLTSRDLVDKCSGRIKAYWYMRPTYVYCDGRRKVAMANIVKACKQIVNAGLRIRVFCLAVNIYDQVIYGVQCDDFVQTGLMFADRDAAEQIAIYLAKKYYIDDDQSILGLVAIKKAWLMLNIVHLEQTLLCDIVEGDFDKYVSVLIEVNLSCCDVAAVKLICEKM